jgi:hypothetical protein
MRMARKRDVDVTSVGKLRNELGPDEVIITKDQLFNILDACWEAWGSTAIVGDLEVAAWGRDIGAPEWVDEWLSTRVD